MTEFDDLDLMDATTPPTVNVTAKRCRRHDWGEQVMPSPLRPTFDFPVVLCRHCGKVKDPTVSRRSRNNKNRGLRIQRQRIEALGGTNLAGNNQNLDGIGIRFRYESKSGPSAFSERAWKWLKGIPTTSGQVGVLIVTDTPGPGRRARSYVVIDFDDWRDEHGEVREDTP